MKNKNVLLFLLFAFPFFSINAQYKWSGPVESDELFKASNWKDVNTDQSAADGSIVSGKPINNNLIIENASLESDKGIEGFLHLGNGTLKMTGSVLKMNYIKETTVKGLSAELTDSKLYVGNIDELSMILSGKSELHLYDDQKILRNKVKIDIKGEDAWVFFLTAIPSVVIKEYLSSITIDGQIARDGSNMRVEHYMGGSVVIPHKPSYKALEVFSGTNLSGESKFYRASPGHYTGAKLGPASDRVIGSFRLKRGYMATISQQINGIGPSKVYIANKEDLIINDKANGTDNTVSFIRIIPWSWVTKKGVGGGNNVPHLDVDWFYDWWINFAHDDTDIEYVPIQQTRFNPLGFASDLSKTNKYTHYSTFNEPDALGPEHLTVGEALDIYGQLLSAGLRMGSPAPVNCGPGHEWLIQFLDGAKERGYRVDYICLHNYEHMSGQQFQDWCKFWWDKYKLPVWVTEFNFGAPWTVSDIPSNLSDDMFEGLKSYVTALDEAPFVERYAAFTHGGCNVLDEKDLLYNFFQEYTEDYQELNRRGIFYRDFQGSQSIYTTDLCRKTIVDARRVSSVDTEEPIAENSVYSLVTRNNNGKDNLRVRFTDNGTLELGNVLKIEMTEKDQFIFSKVKDNIYLFQSVDGKSSISVHEGNIALCPVDSSDPEQLWILEKIEGTKYFAIKNQASNAYLCPKGNLIKTGNPLEVVSREGVASFKFAHFDLVDLLGVSIYPLEGYAPLQVNVTANTTLSDGKPVYYLWNFDNNAYRSTRYEDSYTFMTPGTYNIDVRSRNYKSGDIQKKYTITVKEPNAVKLEKIDTIKIYPNPATDIVNIEGLEGNESIEVYSMQGVLCSIYDAENRQINVSSLSAGCYLLKIGRITSKMLIKQ